MDDLNTYEFGLGLFGVKARIATGVDPRPGLLTRAAGGCVFLDEIGDMPQTLQAKLLRALQEREVMPIGAHQPEPIHVRVLSSTNQDLTAMVRAGRFRADLYFRLRGLEFSLPPLRERLEDVALLALAFTERAATLMKRRSRESPGGPSISWKPTTGRGTCANCAARSNAPSCSVPAGEPWRADPSNRYALEPNLQVGR